MTDGSTNGEGGPCSTWLGFGLQDENSSLSRTVRKCMVETTQQATSIDPFYIVNLGEVDHLLARWKLEMPNIHPYYSVKCNTDDRLIQRLASLGTSFDCASIPEMEQILSHKISPERIIFANPIKTPADLKFAVSCGILDMTFDNADELGKISAHCPNARLYLRIMADDPSAMAHLGEKYGASHGSSKALLHLARDLALNVVGIAFHIGSGGSEANGQAYVKSIQEAKSIMQYGNELGHRIQTLNIGGGFLNATFSDVAGDIRKALDEDDYLSSSGVRIIAEPGTYFAKTVFTLVCNVIGRRKLREGEEQDMLYLNEGVWGSFIVNLCGYPKPHPRLVFRQQHDRSPGPHRYKIWGPTCDSYDKVVDDWEFPREVKIQDWVYFEDMGAYTTSCATGFNGLHPTKAFVYIENE